MRPSNIIIVSLIQSGLGWWARSLTLVNRQATGLQDSPQLLCQSETVSEVAQASQSPFWGTHLAYSSFSASSVIPFIAPACVSLPHSTCTLSPHLFSLCLSSFFCSVIVESSCCVPWCAFVFACSLYRCDPKLNLIHCTSCLPSYAFLSAFSAPENITAIAN